METRQIIRSIIHLSSSRRYLLRPSHFSCSSASITSVARPLSTSPPRNASGQATPASIAESEEISENKSTSSHKQPQLQERFNIPIKPWPPGVVESKSSTSSSSNDDKLTLVTEVLENFIPRSNQPRQSTNPFEPRTSQDEAMYRQVREGLGQSQKSRVPTINLRLGPELGRSVSVDPNAGIDVAAAFQMMETRVRRNRVKSMMMKQRFHVRRGQLKKELRRERWRRLFKMSFQHTLRRCEQLRKQGW
ncbi:uncharacterized protein PADG_00453 [Paracoccidioides brasiliensis Pb18]|uniref:Ribosomal protein S21 n=1 Tax=Paracoccidioides brasiliensis (strain Pb18) TaxID=502780 RepID=C1G0R3_PARBD|nr:uncharacterized protein PADG_00453 [Paracoccidioides brasiliensis Pb18]EEH44164.1 hypothetical protein PADG_00453 [Paracoccidioides brasiliensis Pb18]